MREINYYCDRCNKKVDDLLEINYQAKKKTNTTGYASYCKNITDIDTFFYEVEKVGLCKDCMLGVQEYLTKPYEQHNKKT